MSTTSSIPVIATVQTNPIYTFLNYTKDNAIVAKSKKLAFKEKYKDYEIDMFGFKDVRSRNATIRSVYSIHSKLNQLRLSFYNAWDIDKSIDLESIFEQLDKLKEATLPTKQKTNANRKQASLCIACKESVTGKTNRAKPVSMYYIPCDLCGKESTYLYHLPKTYFHSKDK